MMNSPRKILENELLESFARFLSREQLQKLRVMLAGLSEEEFGMVMQEVRSRGGSLSAKDYYSAVAESLAAQRARNEETALNDVEMKPLGREESEAVWAEIWKSHPSDHVCLTAEEDRAVIELWEKKDPADTIPSDLFFAGTVPLKDCRITVDERDREGGVVCNYRVLIFEDYEERIRRSDEDCSVMVGALIPEVGPGGRFCVPLFVVPGYDSILLGGAAYEPGQAEEMRHHFSVAFLMRFGKALLETWYGIQIALLHPVVREVFRHPAVRKDREALKSKRPGHKRVVRYIKVHVIDQEELEQAMCPDPEKGYSRHALVWYVIGHWRTTAGGARSFVKPYWKGPLRELKMALPDRDRRIVTGSLC